MKIIVCEDSKADRELLCAYIYKFFGEICCPVEIKAYDSGEALLAAYQSLKSVNPKIIFLDIYMEGLTGVETARKIRETDEETPIVFTTTSLAHGLDGYSVQAFQYLVKPLEYEKVEKVLNGCMKLFADSLRFIEVFADRLNVRIYLKDIMYIEVFDHTCHIHTPQEIIKSGCALEAVEKQLDGRMFLRTHRSYLVNMCYVKDVCESDFVMKNGATVPIRRSGKNQIKQAYRDYLFSLSRGAV